MGAGNMHRWPDSSASGCWLRFDYGPQPVAQSFVSCCLEHFNGDLITLARVQYFLGKLLYLIEVALNQIKSCQAVPGGGRLGSGFEQVSLCLVVFSLRQVNLAEPIECSRVAGLEFQNRLKGFLGRLGFPGIESGPAESVPSVRICRSKFNSLLEFRCRFGQAPGVPKLPCFLRELGSIGAGLGVACPCASQDQEADHQTDNETCGHADAQPGPEVFLFRGHFGLRGLNWRSARGGRGEVL